MSSQILDPWVDPPHCTPPQPSRAGPSPRSSRFLGKQMKTCLTCSCSSANSSSTAKLGGRQAGGVGRVGQDLGHPPQHTNPDVTPHLSLLPSGSGPPGISM